MTAFTFTDEKDQSRYTLHRGDDLVSVLDYRDDGQTLAMTRAYTIPTFRGHGYAGELVARAVADVAARGEPVGDVPADGADDAVAAHPEHAGLLAQRRAG